MSEEKKNIEQERLELNREKLEQVAGGGDDDDVIELHEVKPHCPFCGSSKFYSYDIYFNGGKNTLYKCPDCGYVCKEPY